MNKKADRAEVLIIGAGVSGAIAAKHLAEAGVRVVCLEQGRKVEPEEFYGDKPEWELMSQKRWHPNPNVRDQPTDYPIDVSESDVNPLMYSAVGGSSGLASPRVAAPPTVPRAHPSAPRGEPRPPSCPPSAAPSPRSRSRPQSSTARPTLLR